MEGGRSWVDGGRWLADIRVGGPAFQLAHTNIISHKMPYRQTLPITKGGISSTLGSIHDFALFLICCALSTHQKTHKSNYTHHGQSPPLSLQSFYGNFLATTTGALTRACQSSSLVMVVALYPAIKCMAPLMDRVVPAI